jgi:hypothetical protein
MQDLVPTTSWYVSRRVELPLSLATDAFDRVVGDTHEGSALGALPDAFVAAPARCRCPARAVSCRAVSARRGFAGRYRSSWSSRRGPIRSPSSGFAPAAHRSGPAPTSTGTGPG